MVSEESSSLSESTSSCKSKEITKSKSFQNTLIAVLKFIFFVMIPKILWYLFVILLILVVIFRLIVSPPLHWFMDVHTIEENGIYDYYDNNADNDNQYQLMMNNNNEQETIIRHHHDNFHNNTTAASITRPTTKSIYVKGAGFSGFWYHVGYIKSILQKQKQQQQQQTGSVNSGGNSTNCSTDAGSCNSNVLSANTHSNNNNNEYDFYCYSSGCLSVVMSLLTNLSIKASIEKVSQVQKLWLEDKKITQYDLIHYLVDVLLDKNHLIIKDFSSSSSSSSVENNNSSSSHNIDSDSNSISVFNDLLSRIHILVTTIGSGSSSPSNDDDDSSSSSSSTDDGSNKQQKQQQQQQQNGKRKKKKRRNSLLTVNKAKDINELRTLLIRTCWIPYITADYWYIQDDFDPYNFLKTKAKEIVSSSLPSLSSSSFTTNNTDDDDDDDSTTSISNNKQSSVKDKSSSSTTAKTDSSNENNNNNNKEKSSSGIIGHLDGAFTQALHPKCTYELDVPTTFDMYWNILNPSLSSTKAYNFWKQGLEYGKSINFIS